MHTHADKLQENQYQTVANAISKKQNSSTSTFKFIDNRPEAIVQRKLQEMANNRIKAKQVAQLQINTDNYFAQSNDPVQREAFPIIQRTPATYEEAIKGTRIATQKDLEKLLERIGDNSIRDTINIAGTTLVEQQRLFIGGKEPLGGRLKDQNQLEKVFAVVPAHTWWESNNTEISIDGAVIHEITHVAEMMANKGDLADGPARAGELNTPFGVRSDGLNDVVQKLFQVLNDSKADLEIQDFKSEDDKSDVTLYQYLLERVKYAGQHVTQGNTLEIPTVVNQMKYVMDKLGGKCQTTSFYIHLGTATKELHNNRKERQSINQTLSAPRTPQNTIPKVKAVDDLSQLA